MFGVDTSELFLIAVVALVFIGPKDLPKAMRSIGQWVVANGCDFAAADLAVDTRLPDIRRGSVLGLPLACRGRVVGALIAFDRLRSAGEPKLSVRARAVLESALEPGALAPLREAIRRLLNDPELAARLGAEARATVVRDFSREAVVDRYRELIHDRLPTPAGVA